uniref:Uncharacterized protein n=1 Tax=Musca domestica TaxID=7370 RepID=A0A1I8NL87_MUSDO
MRLLPKWKSLWKMKCIEQQKAANKERRGGTKKDTGEAEAEEISSKLLNRESGINQKARKRKQIKSNNKNMCLAAEYRQVHTKKKRKKGSAKIYNNLRNFSLQPNMLSLKSIEIPTRRIHHTNSKPKQQRTNKATEHKQVVHTYTLPTHPLTNKEEK